MPFASTKIQISFQTDLQHFQDSFYFVQKSCQFMSFTEIALKVSNESA